MLLWNVIHRFTLKGFSEMQFITIVKDIRYEPEPCSAF